MAVLAGLLQVFFARQLGPVDFGVLATLLAVCNLIALASSPLQSALCRSIALESNHWDPNRIRGMTRAVLSQLVLWYTPIVVVAALLLAVWFHNYLTTLCVLFLYCYCSVILMVPRAVMHGTSQFAGLAANLVVDGVVRACVSVVLVLQFSHAAGAAIGYFVGSVAALISGMWQTRSLWLAPSTNHGIDGFWRDAAPLWSITCYYICIQNLDLVAAGYFLSTQETGEFAAAVAVSKMLLVLMTPVASVLLPRVAWIKSQEGNWRRLSSKATFRVLLLIAVTINIPIFFGTMLLANIFGTEFAPGAPVMIISWISTALLGLQVILWNIALGAGKSAKHRWFLAPCLVQLGLYGVFHANTIQIALGTLIAVLCCMGSVRKMLATPDDSSST